MARALLALFANPATKSGGYQQVMHNTLALHAPAPTLKPSGKPNLDWCMHSIFVWVQGCDKH